MSDYLRYRWRTGRHNGRTIYAQLGLEPDREVDETIGMLDTPELAAEAVECHNARLQSEDPDAD